MAEKTPPKCTHRFPTDLRQRICEWFDAIQMAAFDEELEWLVKLGFNDPNYDPIETTEVKVRRSAVEYIEPNQFIECMLAKCGQSRLELAIIETLLVENGFEKIKLQDEVYSWSWPSSLESAARKVTVEQIKQPTRRIRLKMIDDIKCA